MGMKGGRSPTRRSILEAAREVFGERGYHAASIDDVTRAAGTTKGAMYWHFRDKRDLYLAAALEAADAYRRAVLEPLEGASSLPQVVGSLFELNARFYAENPKIARFYSTMTFEGQILSESRLVRHVVGIYAEYRRVVARALSRALRRPAGRLENAAASLIALCDGLFIQHAADPQGFPLEPAFKAAAEIALDGLARPGRKGGA